MSESMTLPPPVEGKRKPSVTTRGGPAGSKMQPPDTESERLDPTIEQANTVLQKRITELTTIAGIDKIDPNLKGWKKLKAMKEMAKHKEEIGEIQGLQFALQADGPLSPFLKSAALTELARTTEGTPQHTDVRKALDAIKPQAVEAGQTFFTRLQEGYGVSSDIIAEITKDPHKALTENKKVIKALSKLPLQQYFFQNPPSAEDAKALADNLTPEQQAALDEDEKEGGSGKLSILLMILLAPLLAAGALAFGATTLVGKGLAGAGGQQGY